LFKGSGNTLAVDGSDVSLAIPAVLMPQPKHQRLQISVYGRLA